jgi:hypothetical protein
MNANIRHAPSVGETFGRLTVVEADLRSPASPRQLAIGKPGDLATRVRCECGATFVARNAALFHKNKPTRSCRRCSHFTDGAPVPTVGQRFKKLTVTALGQTVTVEDKTVPAVQATCDCGNTITIGHRQLTLLTFCSPTCPLRTPEPIYKVGDSIGRRTVEQNGLRTAQGLTALALRCECGSLKTVSLSSVPSLMRDNSGCRECITLRKPRVIKTPRVRPFAVGDRVGLRTIEEMDIRVTPDGPLFFSLRCSCGDLSKVRQSKAKKLRAVNAGCSACGYERMRARARETARV